MEEFPVEVTTEILARLPVRSILRSRSVSKTWKDIIDNHVSPSLHLDGDVALGKNLPISFFAYRAYDYRTYPIEERASCRTYLVEQEEHEDEGGLSFKATDVNFPQLTTYREFDLVHFARGLFHLSYYTTSDIDGEQIYHDSICNPFTGKYLHLPLILAHDIQKGMNLGGFGYDPSTGVFKVIRAYFYYHTAEVDFLVYTLGSNSWRKIDNFPQEEYTDLRGDSNYQSRSVSVDSMLHWFSNHDDLLLTFDIASEKFGHMQLPEHISSGYPRSLYNLNGCLSYTDGYRNGYDYCDLWVMKDYGVPESWTKLVIFLGSNIDSFDYLVNFDPILLLNESEILLLFNRLGGGDLLLVHNFESGINNPLHMRGMSENMSFQAHPYCGNLLSFDPAD